MWEWFKGSFLKITDDIRLAIDRTWNFLKDNFKVMLDFFLELPATLWKLVEDTGMAVYNFFFHEDYGLVWWCFTEVCDFIEWCNELVSFTGLVESFLEPYEDEITSSMELVSGLNAFFPIEETIILLGTYLSFVGIVLTCRLALKCIPGAGG
jgi:hypothetical protein